LWSCHSWTLQCLTQGKEKQKGKHVCPESTKKIQEEQLVQNLCPEFVLDTAELLEDLLAGAT